MFRILKAKDYWFRFEYQHRGSPHVHGVTWLQDAPDVMKVLVSGDPTSQQQLINYIDRTVTSINPAVIPDCSNVSDAPLPNTNPHTNILQLHFILNIIIHYYFTLLQSNYLTKHILTVIFFPS